MDVIEIKHRFTGEVLFTGEAGMSLRDTLEKATAKRADLRRADLRGADLRRADLQGADLQGADLQGADLRRADLQGADLQGADLQGAYLQGADLQGADLQGADLQGAKGADYAIAVTRILPEGELIGWKKCRNGVLVKMQIPAAAKRSHAFGRKCRAEYVQVLEVIGAEVAISSHDGKTEYRVGETVRPDSFSDDWMEECANGIHFFITRIEAENY